MPDRPPALTRIGTRHALPLLTWHPHWRPFLSRFAGLDHPAPEVVDWPYAELEALPHVPYDLAALPDDVARSLGELADAIYRQPAPAGGAALLADMTDELGAASLAFTSAVAAAMCQATGDPTCAVYCPILDASSTDNGYLDMHADLFRTRLLFNFVERPAPPGDADALLMPSDTFLTMIDGRLSAEERQLLVDALAYRIASPDVFDRTIVRLWTSPGSEDLRREVREASLRLSLGAGEGYIVVDGTWVHGRTWMTESSTRWDRLHRLSHDNVDTHGNRPPIIDL